MMWNWKIFLLISIAVLIAVILFLQFGTKVSQTTEKEQAPSSIVEEPAVLPPATGNVDDAVNAVFAAADNELSVLNEYDVDISLIEDDSQTISDFGQVYDEYDKNVF